MGIRSGLHPYRGGEEFVFVISLRPRNSQSNSEMNDYAFRLWYDQVVKGKQHERERAILLRQSGLSYSEILRHVSVAKSTLSLWFRDVHLARRQQQRLTERRRSAQLRGAEARHRNRIEQTALIVDRSRKEVKKLDQTAKWLIGVVLYWAEGSKQRNGYWGGRVQFGNSDPRMARLFQKWLLEVIKIDSSEILYEIYIHENNKYRISEVKRYWSTHLSVSPRELERIYFKRHNIKTNRKNQGNEYYGLVRLSVRASSALNRRITGWVEGVVENWGIV